MSLTPKNILISNLLHLVKSQPRLAEKLEVILGTKDILKQGEAQFLEMDISFAQLLAIGALLKMPLERLLTKDLAALKSIASNIRFLVIDVDGVLTDGGMYYAESGDEFKKFNTKDGLIIRRLTKKGFSVGIASNGFLRSLVEKRADLLGIQKVYVGREQKTGILQSWLEDMQISWEQVAYIGDDLNDLGMMEKSGLSACPSDASEAVKAVSHITLQKKGGEGCVREFIETYMGEHL